MKPKDIAIMLLGKKKPESSDDAEGGEPKMPPLADVMREFIDAVKSNDPEAAAKAFRGAVACADEPDDSEETEDTDDEE